MKVVRPPAFQFYATDWNGSAAVTMMTARQCGFYINLMARAWDSLPIGTLPNDPDLLWRLARAANKKEFEAESALVLKQFRRSKNGRRLVHPRLLSERQKQLDFQRQCSAAGLKSANMRKNKKIEGNERSTDLPTTCQPEGQGRVNRNPTLHSSSSSSSLKKEKTLAHAVSSRSAETETAGASPSPSDIKKAIGKTAQKLHPRNGTSTGLRAHIEAGIFRKKIADVYHDATNGGIAPNECILQAVAEGALSLSVNRSVELKGLTHGELAERAWAKIAPSADTINLLKNFDTRRDQVVAVSVRCVTEVAMEFLAARKETV